MSVEKLQEYDAALAENSQKVLENQKEHELANLKIIDGLVERKLMQDGVLTDEEFNWLIKKRQAWGFYSADVVAKAQAAWQEADRITSSIANIPDHKTSTIDIVTNYFENVEGSSGGNRDSGGPGVAGRVYEIGVGAQPELFVAPSNGTFIPASQLMNSSGGSDRIGELVDLTERLLDAMNPKTLSRAFRDAMRKVG
jgi:hypothetical protein